MKTNNFVLTDYENAYIILDRIMGETHKTRINMMNNDLISRIKEFMENEARSCSMDFGCVTPEYVYRMWGGQVPINEIEQALKFQDSRFMFQV